MLQRIEVNPLPDSAINTRALERFQDIASGITKVNVVSVLTVKKDLSADAYLEIANAIHNPVIQSATLEPTAIADFDHVIEIGFLPGVTDNVAHTTAELIEDLLKVEFSIADKVASSTMYMFSGAISDTELAKLKISLHNQLIQRCQYVAAADYGTKGIQAIIPEVHLQELSELVTEVDLEVSDTELAKLGKEGIANADGTRRGPLALSLLELQTIRDYFRKQGRQPTDIELECIAQTWSEHCKHKIFASPIDDIKNGLYKSYIKKATNDIRAAKGTDDFCESVFKDNSGAIHFNKKYNITDKAETHNSPSALDPFGGAITGIVGVNRDTMGFGRAAMPVANRYGFCFADPADIDPLYRGENKTNPMLPPKTIIDGVVYGVEAGGNQSGIPGPQGFIYFNERYKGKPLIFVGTVGLIPKEIAGHDSNEKAAQPGDLIVVAGGRVGQDGIHGATFSSESLDSGSPSTAVQIGDPITQKRLLDAVITEARDANLYNSITDCGAGGISCSVAEMARECGGCVVELEKVPLKYPNLEPWKIWISESQERMTFSVPQNKWSELQAIFAKHGVEAVAIGEFTAEAKCIVKYNSEIIFDLDMEFLHDGVPLVPLSTKEPVRNLSEPSIDFPPTEIGQTIADMLARPNIASYEEVSTLFDHEVKGNSILKPIQGAGHVNAPATVIKPDYESWKGAVISQGINPLYSDIDTYHMAASAIDTAIRNAVAVGANVDYLALMDNFCWCSSNEPERLYELKEAVRACYDYAVAFGTPYISGKDSMFNDFNGYDASGQSVKISVPPTLLVSSLGVVPDVRKSVSIDPKVEGDLIYIIGETKNELGGSEFYYMHNQIGKHVPQVDAQLAYKRYQRYFQAVQAELIVSSCSVGFGGLAMAFAKKAIAGQLGLNIDLTNLPHTTSNLTQLLFSESQSRFVVTVNPALKAEFEAAFAGDTIAHIGTVASTPELTITSGHDNICSLPLEKLTAQYHSGNKRYQ